MKNSLTVIAASAAALFFLGSCQVEEIGTVTPGPSVASAGFTINATYGTPESKAAFNADGLSLSWTEGDVLYLVDPDGKKDIVTLTTDITDSCATARFHTDVLIEPGKYLVVYGQKNLSVQKTTMISKNPSDLNEEIRLYGNVEVALGQTDADVVLHHLYSMLSFQFINVPGEFSNLSLGMAVAYDGLKYLNEGTITLDGLETGYSGEYRTMLGIIDGYGPEDKARVLIAPVDLSSNVVIFFVTWHNGSSRSVRTFVKSGINLQAGKAYNIKLDFSKASSSVDYDKIESGASIIRTADDFLAAALLASNKSFDLQADIDFSGKIFLPAGISFLNGNGHTLSNIQCGLGECVNVGVLSEGGARNLNVVNALFTGKNNVGAISGYGYCEGCSCNAVTVTGQTNVGGIVGRANGEIRTSSISGISSISGVDRVGGIVGYSSYAVSRCITKGTVVVAGRGEKAGGIAGYADGGVSECGFEGSVTGTYTVGGVSGEGSCSKSFCIGDVTGTNNVGGVSGCSSCSDCYHIGDVLNPENNNCGGICGAATGTEGEEDVTVANCYSCGSVSSGYGICPGTVSSCRGTNLTSLEAMYAADSPSANCLCSPSKTFVSKLDVLNGINGNGAYLKLCIPDNAYGCPVLAWQYEGFGSGITIPGFKPISWE